MKPALTILSFFVIAQIIGMFVGISILLDMNSNPYVKELVVTGDVDEPANALLFIGYVLAGAVIMVLLIRYFGAVAIIFRVMEFTLISTSSSIVFYSVFRLWMGFGDSMLAGIVLGLLLAVIKIFRPGLKNAAAILATAGVGVVFGISLGLVPVIIFLILLAVYDYLSVFATRHMVELANFVMKKELVFTVTAREPPPPGRPPEEGKRMDLGTGDMIAPIMMEVSALTFSPAASLFVFAGAVVSMGIFVYFVSKRKMVLPALPPIVLGMLAALGIGLLLGVY